MFNKTITTYEKVLHIIAIRNVGDSCQCTDLMGWNRYYMD